MFEMDSMKIDDRVRQSCIASSMHLFACSSQNGLCLCGLQSVGALWLLLG